MEDNIIIGVDLAKNVFQLHGASRDGHVLFRKKLSRTQFKVPDRGSVNPTPLGGMG